MEKPYVGFWWRFLASIIDSIIIWVMIFAVFAVVGISVSAGAVDPATGMPQFNAVAYLVQMIIFIGYFGVMQGSSLQATVGKMAIGAVVTDLDGDRLSFGRSFLRAVCMIPSSMILLIGYIMVAFTGRKQGLHDIMAGTLVLKRRVVREAMAAEA